MQQGTRSYRYKAFISYSHRGDEKLAKALQSALQDLARPSYLMPAMAVFRDQTELSANPALWPTIQRALEDSEYFILLASPLAAQSHWVKREIDYWLRLHQQKSENLFIVVTDGILPWDSSQGVTNWDAATALPQRLDWERDTTSALDLSTIFTVEPLYVDFRGIRDEPNLSLTNGTFLEGVASLAAPLRGKKKSELIGEDAARQRKYKRIRKAVISALSFLLLLAISFAVYAELKREQAERSEMEMAAALERESKAKQQAEDALKAQKKAQEETQDALCDAEMARGIAEEKKKEADKQRGIAEAQTEVAEQRRREAETNLAAYYFSGSQLEAEERNNPIRAFVWASKASETAPASDARSSFYTARAHHLRLGLPVINNLNTVVNSASINPDLSRVAVKTDAGVKIWTLNQQQSVTLEAPSAGFQTTSLVFSDDGKYLAGTITESNGTSAFGARVWSSAAGKLQPDIRPSVQFPTDRVSTFPANSAVVLMDRDLRHMNHSLLSALRGTDFKYSAESDKNFGRLARSRNQPWFLVVSNDSEDKQYSVEVVDYWHQKPAFPQSHAVMLEAPVFSVAFGPTSDWFATVSSFYDKLNRRNRFRIQLWGTRTGKWIETYQMADEDPFKILDISKDERKILTQSTTGELRVWDLDNRGHDHFTLIPVRLAYYCVIDGNKYTGPPAFFGADDTVVTISGCDSINGPLINAASFETSDYEVRLWNWKSVDETATQMGKTARIPRNTVSFAIEPDSLRLATVSPEGVVKRSNLAPAPNSVVTLKDLDMASGRIENAVISPDHNTILVSWSDYPVALKTNAWTGSFEVNLMLHDLKSGRAAWPHSIHLKRTSFRPTFSRFSKDGSKIVTAFSDDETRSYLLQVWNSKSGEALLAKPILINGKVRDVALNVDGSIVLAAFESEGGLLKVQTWQTSTGETALELPGFPRVPEHSSRFEIVGFTNDAEHLVAGEPASDWNEYTNPYAYKNLSLRRVQDLEIVSPVFRFERPGGVTSDMVTALVREGGKFDQLSKKQIVVRSSNGAKFTIRNTSSGVVIDTPEGRMNIKMAEREKYDRHLSFSQSGLNLAYVLPNGREARVWDSRTGLPSSEGLLLDSWLAHMTFLDNRTLLTVTQNGMICRWNLGISRDESKRIGEELKQLQGLVELNDINFKK